MLDMELSTGHLSAQTAGIPLSPRQIALAEVRGAQWVMMREAGKMSHRDFTDAIAKFNAYEDEEGGATAPHLAFSNFTRTIYAPLGLNKKQIEDCENRRDTLDLMVLNALRLIEASAAKIIYQGMAEKRRRKEIKIAVKKLAVRLAETIMQIEKGDFFEVVR